MGIKLNRNAWHRRLQKYVLDKSTSHIEDTMNLCPYFWLTIFCVIVVPFVFIWRSFNTGLDKAEKLFSNLPWVKAFVAWQNQRLDNFISSLTPSDLLKLYESDSKRASHVVSSWLDYVRKTKLHKKAGYSDVWDYYFNLVREERRKRYDQKQQAYQEKRKRELMFQKIGKTLGLTLLAVIVPFVIFVIYSLISYLWDTYNFDLQLFLTILGNLLFILVFLFIGAGVGTVLKRVFPKVSFLWDDHLKKYLVWVFWYPIKYTFVGIWEGLKFVWTYISNTKDNYCPSI